MLRVKKSKVKAHLVCLGLAVLLVVAPAIAPLCGDAAAAGAKKRGPQTAFASPEEAVGALVNAAKADDVKGLSAILGPDGKRLIFSGDQVADRNGRDRFMRFYEEKNALIKETGDKAVLQVGNDAWPFPVPIVKADGEWRFDTKEGIKEILDRRIGRNELSTIQACLAYVDAQQEYASKDRNGDGLLEYARKFASEPGKKDGLYWESKEGEEQSPLGPLVASARKEGYAGRKAGEKPQPYHGYLYKILTAQGKNAPRGAHDYLARGKLIGGFALVAYPAEYGSSGIMTFIVSHSGDVYEKDLGRRTRSAAGAIKTFDPDKSWRKVEPKFLEPSGKAGGA